jgi:hypothetical protein
MIAFARYSTRCFGAALAAVMVGAAAHADAPPVAAPHSNAGCFFSSQWRGWKSPSPTVLYLRVNQDIYRVDLSVGTKELQWPGVHLVSEQRGGDTICSALDLDLSVVPDAGGFHEHLFAKSITKLTPAEAAAVPLADRP